MSSPTSLTPAFWAALDGTGVPCTWDEWKTTPARRLAKLTVPLTGPTKSALRHGPNLGVIAVARPSATVLARLVRALSKPLPAAAAAAAAGPAVPAGAAVVLIASDPDAAAALPAVGPIRTAILGTISDDALASAWAGFESLAAAETFRASALCLAQLLATGFAPAEPGAPGSDGEPDDEDHAGGGPAAADGPGGGAGAVSIGLSELSDGAADDEPAHTGLGFSNTVLSTGDGVRAKESRARIFSAMSPASAAVAGRTGIYGFHSVPVEHCRLATLVDFVPAGLSSTGAPDDAVAAACISAYATGAEPPRADAAALLRLAALSVSQVQAGSAAPPPAVTRAASAVAAALRAAAERCETARLRFRQSGLAKAYDPAVSDEAFSRCAAGALGDALGPAVLYTASFVHACSVGRAFGLQLAVLGWSSIFPVDDPAVDAVWDANPDYTRPRAAGDRSGFQPPAPELVAGWFAACLPRPAHPTAAGGRSAGGRAAGASASSSSRGAAKAKPVTAAIRKLLNMSPQDASDALSGSSHDVVWLEVCRASPGQRLGALRRLAGRPGASAAELWGRLADAGASGSAADLSDLLSGLPRVRRSDFGDSPRK